jgi:hypothetical protein
VGWGTVTAERLKRRAKPGRLFAQLLEPLFDALADLLNAPHSSSIVKAPRPILYNPCPASYVELDATPRAAENATRPSNAHDSRRCGNAAALPNLAIA